MTAPLRIVGSRSAESHRLADALFALVAERGYAETTPEAVWERAGLDEAAFARHFAALPECFLAVWDVVDVELSRRVADAFEERPGPWRERFRAALDAGLRFLAADEGRARLYVTDALYAGEEVAERRRRSLQRLAELIDRARVEMADPERVPSLIADGIAGGIWHRVFRLVGAGRYAELPAELPDLMYVAVLPYCDAHVAEEELRPSA